MTGVVETLAGLLAPWQSIYSDSTAVSVSITAAHIVALLVGGGFAIAMDRMTMRMNNRSSPQLSEHLGELHDVHRPVIIAVAVLAVSGVLMAAADIEEFAANPVFWLKLALVVLLLINGWLLQRAESRVNAVTDLYATADPQWKRLAFLSRTSMLLWIGTTIAGVVLAG
jgi:hypothetical protein